MAKDWVLQYGSVDVEIDTEARNISTVMQLRATVKAAEVLFDVPMESISWNVKESTEDYCWGSNAIGIDGMFYGPINLYHKQMQ
jgi:hypothetical protein